MCDKHDIVMEQAKWMSINGVNSNILFNIQYDGGGRGCVVRCELRVWSNTLVLCERELAQKHLLIELSSNPL